MACRSVIRFLQSWSCSSISNLDDILGNAHTFSDVLNDVINRHVPKTSHHLASRSPWQMNELRRRKSRKRLPFRKYTKHRTTSFRRSYVHINHEYKRVMMRCFLQYQQGIKRKLKACPVLEIRDRTTSLSWLAVTFVNILHENLLASLPKIDWLRTMFSSPSIVFHFLVEAWTLSILTET